MLTRAFQSFLSIFTSAFTSLNLSITLGNYTFGLLDFLVITMLLGIVVRNFVHAAR